MEVVTFFKSALIKKWARENLGELAPYFHIEQFSHFDRLVAHVASRKNVDMVGFFVLLEEDDELFGDYVLQIKQVLQGAKVMAVGLTRSISTVEGALIKGANTYIDVSINALELTQFITHLKHYTYYVDPNISSQIIEKIVMDHTGRQVQQPVSVYMIREKMDSYKFTMKETEVLEYLLKGYTYKRIAELLCITSFAINQRTKSIYRKCGVRSRNELSYLFLR